MLSSGGTRQLSICILVLLFANLSANAQVKHTSIVPVGGPPGAAIDSIEIDPNNSTIIYAVANGGVLKSVNAGEKWTAINHGLETQSVRSIVMSSSRPTTLYVATRDGIFKSLNAGKSWIHISAGLPRMMFVVAVLGDPADSNILYVATESHVFKTIDGGRRWKMVATQKLQPRNTDSWLQGLAIDLLNPATIYAAAGDGGLLKSTDRGGHWKVIYRGDAHGALVDPSDSAVIYITSGGEILKSVDAGKSWSRIQSPQQTYSFKLSINRGDPGALCAISSTGQIFRSKDRGESWEEINAPYASLNVVLAGDPVHPGTLYVGSKSGIFKSSDGGNSWRPINNGVGSMPVHAIAVAPSAHSVLYALGAALAKSVDGGQTWSQIDLRVTGSILTSYGAYAVQGNVMALAIDPLDADKLHAMTGYGVFKSTDGGETWSKVSNVMEGQAVCSVFVDPSNPAVLYATATSDGKAFKSTDGGDTWEELEFGFPRLGGCGLLVDPADSSVLFATSETGIIRSTDGGESWRKLSSETGANARLAGTVGQQVDSLVNDPDDASILYAASPLGILRSPDRGRTWAVISSAAQVKGLLRFVIDPHNPRIIYGEGNGLYKTTNAGQTWKQLKRGLPPGGAGNLALVPSDSNTLYVATGRGVFKSANGGESWQPTGTKE